MVTKGEDEPATRMILGNATEAVAKKAG